MFKEYKRILAELTKGSPCANFLNQYAAVDLRELQLAGKNRVERKNSNFLISTDIQKGCLLQRQLLRKV
ncbi:hypothetical protein DP923_15285 [Pontibacter arcticus]|uniref:Uncharacterized protein n=1 Tax=Pontibacter arcticus TaxID=2080288 RepID=A0A364RAZ7_9BACT|nr:hypothetical protein DP923_15285 [Pontibacter arcticus]